MKRILLLTALPLFILQFGASSVQAQSQTWGTSVSLTPDLARLSDGSNMPSTIIWTLGWFDDGFSPSTSNYDLWVDSYNEVDRDSFFMQQGLYNVSGDSPGTSAAALASVGKQMWVFAYNDLGLIGTPAGEALLYTDGTGRLFPASPSPGETFDIADGPTAIDNNFSIIWGRVDRNAYGVGGVLTGGGVMTGNPGDGTTGNFEVQTASFVPEPSSILLSVLGAAAFCRRSRSRA